MNVTKADIEGLLVVEPDIFRDDRGYFLESYNSDRYREAGIPDVFVQDNVSVSKKGVIRGLHYQTPPFAQGKLVSVLRGRVLDVVVDIRTGSPTFGRYVAVELSAENHRQFWIPAGFAHGFIALEDDTIFTYKVTNVYDKESDRGVRWNDPALGIAWPTEVPPIVSEKDTKLPLLKDIAQEFVWES
ncbi:MAG: dTDP-4-dehydrorhamnose 3,5-epimerase [Candidatus Moraniibacteriota bacterium]|nr:MAG: dTDP-4-dehydrorhamnose 3,5-epimerase [Candidatus Moranbacteria bacterium]